MLLKEFGFYLKFLAYSTASCIEGKGCSYCNNPAGLCCVLGVEVFLPAGFTKSVLATSPKGRINGTNSEEMHLQTIGRTVSWGKFHSTEWNWQFWSSFIKWGDLSELELLFAGCLVVCTWLEGFTRRSHHGAPPQVPWSPFWADTALLCQESGYTHIM